MRLHYIFIKLLSFFRETHQNYPFFLCCTASRDYETLRRNMKRNYCCHPQIYENKIKMLSHSLVYNAIRAVRCSKWIVLAWAPVQIIYAYIYAEHA